MQGLVDGDLLLFVCLFVCPSVANAYLSGTGLPGPAMLVVVSGQSTAGPSASAPHTDGDGGISHRPQVTV